MTYAQLCEKIEKLLALSESPNEHEAASAARKVQTLLTQYNLELDLVLQARAGSRSSATDIGVATIPLSTSQRAEWEIQLVHSICTFGYCKALVSPSRFTIIGTEADRTVAVKLITRLRDRLQTLAYQRTREYSTAMKQLFEQAGITLDMRTVRGPDHPKAWRTSWILGAVRGIHEQLCDQWDESHQTYGTSMTALVLDRSSRIDAYTESHYPRMARRELGSNPLNYDAYLSGRHEGQSLSLAYMDLPDPRGSND